MEWGPIVIGPLGSIGSGVRAHGRGHERPMGRARALASGVTSSAGAGDHEADQGRRRMGGRGSSRRSGRSRGQAVVAVGDELGLERVEGGRGVRALGVASAG